MTDLPGDPNWLLSSLVLSAAIIVGLLGFLVVSRRASLLSEQRSLQLRRRQVELILTAKGARQKALEGSAEVAESQRLSEEIEVLEIEHNTLDEALNQLIQAPSGSRFSLLLLVYLSGVGILFPLILMPARTSAFDPTAFWSLGGLKLSGLGWKRLLEAAFASGLLATVAHIGWTTLRKVRNAPKVR